MTASALLVSPQCFAMSRRSLHQLRASLERDLGLQTATWLQEAGFAGGEAIYQAYRGWVAGRFGIEEPAGLDVRHLGETLTGFFRETGWGSLSVAPIAQAVIALDSGDWSEADPTAGSEYPSCHLSSGMLADFLGRVSNTTLGVMEVECVSRGDTRCRFLAGSPDTLQLLYDRMAHGQPYLEALGSNG